MAGTERVIHLWLHRVKNVQYKYAWPRNYQFSSTKEYIKYDYRNWSGDNDGMLLARAIVDPDEKPVLILINDDELVQRNHIQIVKYQVQRMHIPYAIIPFAQMINKPCYINLSEYFDGRYVRPERQNV